MHEGCGAGLTTFFATSSFSFGQKNIWLEDLNLQKRQKINLIIYQDVHSLRFFTSRYSYIVSQVSLANAYIWTCLNSAAFSKATVKANT